jgi:hypothetical protein
MLTSNLSAIENDTWPVAFYFLNNEKYWLFEGLADKLKGTNLQVLGGWRQRFQSKV